MRIIVLMEHCISDIAISTGIEVFFAPVREEADDEMEESRDGTQIVDGVSALVRKSTRCVKSALSESRENRESSENFFTGWITSKKREITADLRQLNIFNLTVFLEDPYWINMFYVLFNFIIINNY